MVSIDQSRARSRIGTLDHPGIFVQIQGITANLHDRSFSYVIGVSLDVDGVDDIDFSVENI